MGFELRCFNDVEKRHENSSQKEASKEILQQYLEPVNIWKKIFQYLEIEKI